MKPEHARRSIAAAIRTVGRFARDRRGSAAVEFALWSVVLILPIMSVIEIGNYVYQKMQLQNATQSAAQSVLALCNSSTTLLPAATNCPNLNTTLLTVAQSSSLGTNVHFQSHNPKLTYEGYYCISAAGALTQVGTLGFIQLPSGSNSAPVAPTSDTCASVVTGSTTVPGDYVFITTYYAYTPIFPGLTIVSLLPSQITQTAWMRLA